MKKSKLEMLVSRLRTDAAVLVTSEISDLFKLGWIKRNQNGCLYITKKGKFALELSKPLDN